MGSGKFVFVPIYVEEGQYKRRAHDVEPPVKESRPYEPLEEDCAGGARKRVVARSADTGR